MNHILLSLNYFDLRWILGFLTVIIIIFAVLFNKLTGGSIFGYKKYFASKTESQTLIAIQIVISFIIAIILPNNFLTELDYFQNLFKKNGIWIPITMLCVFLILLIFIGILLNVICKALMSGKNKIDEK